MNDNQVRLTEFRNPLTGSLTWGLWRVSDGHAEANGFTSIEEVETFCTDFGWVVDDGRA